MPMVHFAFAYGTVSRLHCHQRCLQFCLWKNKKWQPTAVLAANNYLYYHLNQLDLRNINPSQGTIV